MLTLMSYNIAGGRDYRMVKPRFNPEAVIEVIKKYSPDIVGLNEVDFQLPRSGGSELAKEMGDALGYYSAFSPAVTWAPGKYGNGFLSKHPILFHETIPVPDPVNDGEDDIYHETRCILHAVVMLEGKETDIYATHFGLANSEKKNAIATLLPLLENIKRPTVLMGDFNIPQGDIRLKPIEEKLHNTFAECADKNTFSWPSGESFRNGAERVMIDYIYVSEHFKSVKTEVPEIIASDHKPYVNYSETV